MHVLNFSVCVAVDGKEVEEHGIEYSNDGKEVTCWIASEAGQVGFL
jgi:hypothetical protein